MARAVAQAFASVLGGCETEGKGFACVENEGWIETIAVATAEAVRLHIHAPPTHTTYRTISMYSVKFCSVPAG